MTRRVIAAVVVPVLLVAGYLYVAHTYSLAYGDRGSGPGPKPLNGEPVVVSLTVRNPGRISVGFTGVRLPAPDPAIELIRMIDRAGDGPGCCSPDHTVGFRPVTLVPGSQVMLFLTLRVTGAQSYPPCTGFSLERVLVSYEVLDVSREEPIAFPEPVSFRTPC